MKKPKHTQKCRGCDNQTDLGLPWCDECMSKKWPEE